MLSTSSLDGDDSRRPLAITNDPINEDAREDDASSVVEEDSSDDFSESDEDNPTIMMSKARKQELAQKNLLTKN